MHATPPSSSSFPIQQLTQPQWIEPVNAGRAAKHAFGLKAAKAAARGQGRLSMMASTVGVVESPLEEKTRLSNKVWMGDSTRRGVGLKGVV